MHVPTPTAPAARPELISGHKAGHLVARHLDDMENCAIMNIIGTLLAFHCVTQKFN